MDCGVEVDNLRSIRVECVVIIGNVSRVNGQQVSIAELNISQRTRAYTYIIHTYMTCILYLGTYRFTKCVTFALKRVPIGTIVVSCGVADVSVTQLQNMQVSKDMPALLGTWESLATTFFAIANQAALQNFSRVAYTNSTPSFTVSSRIRKY